MLMRTNIRSVLVFWLLLMSSQFCFALSVPWASGAYPSNISAFEKELTGTDRGKPADSCRLHVHAAHYSIDCRQQNLWTEPRTPEVVSDCGAVVSLTFSDEYFELGCGTLSFTGYFDPARWVNDMIYGDDGVDVTGAPDSRLLVEGTDNALVEVANRPESNFTVVVPANGYVYFDWFLDGSSIIFSDEAAPIIQVNRQEVRLSMQDSQWVTPYLTQGDALTFKMPSVAGTFSIRRFAFYTNASGVILRKWTATDEAGYAATFPQFIALDRPSFSDIYLPGHLPATNHEAFDLSAPPSMLTPHFRGDTLQQHSTPVSLLNAKNNCALDWYWEDELLPTHRGTVLIRHWTVLDWCGENELSQEQYFDLPPNLPLPPLRLRKNKQQHSGEEP